MAAIAAWIAGQWIEEMNVFRERSPGVQWVNWVGEYSCGPHVAIERPKTLSELQQVVKKYRSIRAVATGHSFNTFQCPAEADGAVIDMREFRKVEVSISPRAKCPTCDDGEPITVKAEAGITVGQLQNEILARGLTLRVPPGNPAYTVGGCFATGCHNLGQSHAQDLLAIAFVLANGTLREVKRGEPDFEAAAVSVGRLGIILSVTIEVLAYRPLQWRAEQLPVISTPQIISILDNMTKSVTSREAVGNKLVFYLSTGVMMMEHWVPLGRANALTEEPIPLAPYVNPQVFRLGQGSFSSLYTALRGEMFAMTPKWLLNLLQVPAETAFRMLHSSPLLSTLRKVLGWQHSPENRGDGTSRPTGHQYTWAAWIDEVMNLIMGLRHVEVIFPLEPQDQAARCLETVFAYQHLTWWRLNVRTMKSEDFYLSSVHHGGKGPQTFLRVDFVSPGSLLDLPTGEAALTERLHRDCPGWRKHWGKGLFASSAEERWGEPEKFLQVAKNWDPTGKFKPKNLPSWLK